MNLAIEDTREMVWRRKVLEVLLRAIADVYAEYRFDQFTAVNW